MSQTLLESIYLPDGTASWLLIRDGIVEQRGRGEPAPQEAAHRLDGEGCLVIPALVDGHMHLDKTVTGLPWMPHRAGPDRASRIETEKLTRQGLPPVAERASNLVRQCIAFGTTAIRTHVDVTPELGLAHLEALLEVRERFAQALSMEIVAFPQTGVVCNPGEAALLDQALSRGADRVGGIDPITFDGTPEAQFDVLFDIAARHDAGVDVHLHDPGERGLREIEAITGYCRRYAMGGEVTISHGFALGDAPGAEVDRLAEAMAEAGVSLVTHGGGGSPLPPIKRLREMGVEVFAGNDDVRDPWSPFGNGDMLERAMLLAWRSGYRTDEDLALALDCASSAGARALGLPCHGIEPGDRADLVTLRAETVGEAVVARPARELVLRGGVPVARGGALVEGLEAA